MALLKVKTGILNAIDRKEVMCLVMLDLSAAFNTVNHDLVLNWLMVMLDLSAALNTVNHDLLLYRLKYRL